ncbi:MAG: GNAT family N-acetyltransferase [Pseudomonadota bacterium]|uniref:GNAT family N-acetyltransferase n=1 Tax=Polaromonas sp. TaxID=1869339 RepID=UPI00183E192D|nr:GNAT family N-acetyltransferase [Polaromonas sp.]MBA3592438.1 GNAT family N-acetyltransferase [Polaromonas sp.]MDQ3271583.1 GNAT family N-acetyltransferase [Pseudomonadota bacterium]
MNITWRFAAFDALSAAELYGALQLRTEVFVMEQAGIYQDMDGFDHLAVHVLGASDEQLVAYARCFPAGVKFTEASIGRVITRQILRGSGQGHELMRHAISCVFEHWGAQPIRMGAQARLEKFYVQHGFVKTGLPYIEDGISHIEMLRTV